VALYQSGREYTILGPLGAAVGPAMIGGVYTGFVLSFLVKHLWTYWRRLWSDLIAYAWPLATFITGYIFIIYVFAGLFAMTWRSNPGSLANLNAPASLNTKLNRELPFRDFLYYSVSTVSTLGYSELRPVGMPARILTSAEFLVGIFWVTAAFALLIGQRDKGLRRDSDGMKIWSDVEYVYRCLADTQRTRAFEAAIAACVKPGNVVLDLGTGSGIMALFAARAGARKVYAVEIGDYLSRASEQIFVDNGFGSCIVPLHMDARDVTLQCVEKPDVVTCEMITTGLMGEMQGQVINALKKSGVIDKSTLLIPSALDISASLVQVDYTFFGFQLRFPIFIDYFSRTFDRPFQKLSDETRLHSLEFAEDFRETVKTRTEFKISNGGRVNGLLIKSTTALAAGMKLEDCVSYCQPVIVPTKDLRVSAGDIVALSLIYEIGEGFDKLRCDLEIAG
jgi:predicted RNA methylase